MYQLVSFLKKNPIFQKNWLQVKPHYFTLASFVQLVFKFLSWVTTTVYYFLEPKYCDYIFYFP